jgi:hypothetical protein
MINCLTIVVLLAAASAPSARPVAHVLETKGTVTARTADGATRKIAPFGTVYAQERLDLKADALVVLAFRRDGHIEQAKGPAEVTVTEAGAAPPSAVAVLTVPPKQEDSVAKVIRQLPAATEMGVAVMRGGPSPLLGGPSPLGLSPIVGSTVLTDRPTFRWPASPEPRAYHLTVLHKGEKVWDATTSQPFVPFTASRALERGETYQWNVAQNVNTDASVPVCSGRFTVATAQQTAQAAEIEKLAEGKQVRYLTLAAMWYRQNNMLDEALAAAKRLVDLAPDERAFRTLYSELVQEARAREKADRLRSYLQGDERKG